jgi:sulfite exporter TauE/SafE
VGLFFGLFGQGFVLAGWQNILSITLGLFILLLLFLPKLPIFHLNRGLMFRFLEKIKTQIRNLFGIRTMSSLLFIGILNGLLPCGLVYLGIAGSIATGNIVKGALFMAAFGLGTFPAMLLITATRDHISIRFREKVRKVVPVFIGIMALLLILRGMNLGIPYLSPSVQTSSGIQHMQCCRK